MDDAIVNYPALKQLVATAAGVDTGRASEFLHAFFEIISQELAQGESVKIKGIGTFRRAEDDNSVPTVAFVPDVELADAVNSPFAFFEAVELAPSVSADDLADIGQPSAGLSTEIPPESPETPEAPEAEDTPAEESAYEPEPGTDETEEPAETEEPIVTEDESPDGQYPTSAPDDEETDAPTSDTDTGVTDDTAPSGYAPEEPGDSGFGWPWLIVTLVIGLLIGFGAGYLCHDSLEAHLIGTPEIGIPMQDEISDTIAADTSTVSLPEPAPAAPEPIAEEEIYDTISPTRFLTTMARRHYGQMDYWVYIYMENTDRLSHPDRARPGTVVRIPPISKYVDPADSTALRKARNLGAEIYAKYRR